MTDDLSIHDLGIPPVSRSELPPEHAERLAATLDVPDAPAKGEALPLLWHWSFFTPTEPISRLGEDGHPRRAPHPALDGLPRRMFAGGHVRQRRPFVVGEGAERHARLVAAEPKSGRSGRLLVVTVAYEYHQGGDAVLEEEQSLVYREAGSPVPRPEGDAEPPEPEGGWRDPVVVDEATLFRFSAVTFNSHRIHYDADYARTVEGYPELVVHGPLIAVLLAGSARRRVGDLAAFRFRATAPLFRGLRFFLVGEPDGDGVTLSAVRGDGREAMRASATVA